MSGGTLTIPGAFAFVGPGTFEVTDFGGRVPQPHTCFSIAYAYVSLAAAGDFTLLLQPMPGSLPEDTVVLATATAESQAASFCYPVPGDDTTRVPWSLYITTTAVGAGRVRFAYRTSLDGSR